jgi:hypothetical protein
METEGARRNPVRDRRYAHSIYCPVGKLITIVARASGAQARATVTAAE